MRVSVRLSAETMSGIAKLKELFEKDPKFSGLRITNGFVVNNAFQNLKKDTDWKSILLNSPIYFGDVEDLNTEIKTNLTLNDQVVLGINNLKEKLPAITNTTYVTTPFVIRLIIRAYLIQEKLNDSK